MTLEAVDRYCDAVPRFAADVEEHGALRLFVRNAAAFHPWYARPSGNGVPTLENLELVLARQDELRQPRALEWVGGRPAGLEDLAVQAGLHVHRHPLLVASPEELVPVMAPDMDVRLVRPEDDLHRVSAVANIGFAHPGTEAGEVGVEALDAATEQDPVARQAQAARVAAGRSTVAAAFVDGEPVARGGHTVVDGVSEITAVATLPAFRRRGLGAAVTAVLAQDAVRRGARLVWLSAGDEAVARVYTRLGFREIGVAFVAEA